jgi:hypothetical protein
MEDSNLNYKGDIMWHLDLQRQERKNKTVNEVTQCENCAVASKERGWRRCRINATIIINMWISHGED